jgi:putative ABC transport system permease protein
MSSVLLATLAEGVLYVLRRPLRSAITAITVAVAIAVTVNVISLNYGLDEDVRADITRFGRTTIDVGRSPLIRPGAQRAPFGEAELAQISVAVAGLDAAVVPLRQEMASVTGAVTIARLPLVAVTPDYAATLRVKVLAGRWLTTADHGFDVCVLDQSAAASLFPASAGAADAGSFGAAAFDATAVLGRRLTLSGRADRVTTVVGVLEDPMTYRRIFESFDEGRSSRTLVGALLSFRNVYVPADAMPTDDLTLVNVVLPDERRLEEARERLQRLWPAASMDAIAATASPITVFVRRDWMDALGGTTQGAAFLGNIVWILIVLVACVMISTLNLISIRERYDEIAIRRCEGARKTHIAAQVTAEGVLVSLVGGVLGLPLGHLGAALLRRIVDFPFRFDTRYAGAAMAISAVLGLLASVVPARRAAALDPARVLTRRVT